MIFTQAIDDAGHDKACMLKVKGLEAVDKAIGQLAKLLWEAESSGKFEYFLCVTGDHSTPVEYGDHSFEPVPFALCRLSNYVRARGGEDAVLATSLQPFLLPSVQADEDLLENFTVPNADGRKKDSEACSGDTVNEFDEMSAAKGCLGRFPGSEMMGIIRNFIDSNCD